MPTRAPSYEVVSIPALLRHARHTYGAAMRRALEAAGHDDIPKNGLYVIGGLSRGAGDAPLSELIRDLHMSKQAAGQLVEALVDRGYLERKQDAHDRRRQIVVLTARGHAAAKVQAAAARSIDARLAERVSDAGVGKLRRILAALAAIGGEEET